MPCRNLYSIKCCFSHLFLSQCKRREWPLSFICNFFQPNKQALTFAQLFNILGGIHHVLGLQNRMCKNILFSGDILQTNAKTSFFLSGNICLANLYKSKKDYCSFTQFPWSATSLRWCNCFICYWLDNQTVCLTLLHFTPQ